MNSPRKKSPPSQSLSELQSEWYAKLAAEGFQDIEDHTINGRPLKSWHSFKCMTKDTVELDGIKEYHHIAMQMLETHVFTSEDHKRIWEMHSNGISEREIAASLGCYKKSMVHLIIAEIASKFMKKL